MNNNLLLDTINCLNKTSINDLFKNLIILKNANEKDKLNELINTVNKTIILFKNYSSMDADIDTTVAFTKEPFPLNSNCIELKKSDIHGQGIFATEYIEKDTLITYYPAHAICFEKETNDKGETGFKFSNNKFNPNSDYKLILPEKEYSIVGDNNQINNTLLLGHMFNDSNNIELDENALYERDIKNAIVKYVLSSFNNRNCMFDFIGNNTVCCIKTIKNVKKGEELCLSYGPKYWLSKQQNEIFENICKNDINFSKFMKKNLTLFSCDLK